MRRAIQAVDCLPKRLRIVALPDRRQRTGMSRRSRRPIPVSGRFGAQPAARPHLPAPSSPASCIFVHRWSSARRRVIPRPGSDANVGSSPDNLCEPSSPRYEEPTKKCTFSALPGRQRGTCRYRILRARHVRETPVRRAVGSIGRYRVAAPRARRGMSDGRARGGRPVRPAVQMRPLMQVRSPMQAQLPTGCSYKSVRLHIECGYSIMSSSGSITFRPR